MNDILGSDNDPVITDPTKDYLQELVGDGKKFKTERDLARGKYEADLHIKNLEGENETLRTNYLKLDADYKARAKLEELIDQMNNKQQQQLDHKEPPVKDRETLSMDSKQIESLVSSKLQEYEVSKKQTENSDLVRNKLIERFGSNYKSVVKEQIADIGLSEDAFNFLAKTSPSALLRTLGLDKPEMKESFQSPPRPTQRSDSFKPKGAEKRDWSYYQELKKKDLSLYKDPKTQTQMMKDYVDLGQEFESGDFKSLSELG